MAGNTEMDVGRPMTRRFDAGAQVNKIRGVVRDADSNTKLNMYAVTGVTGKVGGTAARALLAGGQSVRAVVRNPDKGQVWRNLGCDVAVATIEDRASLSVAFQRAEAVFVLVPPNFDPSPEFSEARETGKALHSALAAARPKRVVYLSTVGAQAREMNLLTQHSIIESAIGDLPIPITFLRPAW